MKILIIGGGQVGSTVAKNLVAGSSNNAVTVIDKDERALRLLSESLDIQTLPGNGAIPGLLKAAGAEDTDLFLALTGDDETNLSACLLAQKNFQHSKPHCPHPPR